MMSGEFSQERFFNSECHNRYSVHAAFKHAPDAIIHLLRIVTGRCNEDLVPSLHRDVFEALDEFREKRISNLRDYKAQQPTSSGDQRSRARIGTVIKFFDCFPNSLG